MSSSTSNSRSTTVPPATSTLVVAEAPSPTYHDYLEQSLLGTGDVDTAAIFGWDEAKNLWCSSKGKYAPLSPDQVHHLVACLFDPTIAHRDGITLGGSKFLIIRAEEGAGLQGMMGCQGFALKAAKSCAVLGVYSGDMVPGNCSFAVERLADYLRQHGL